MSDRDNITMPREVAELIENLMHHAYNDGVKQLKYRSSQTVEAEEALRTALAAEQPKQEPVAWMYINLDGECEQIEYGTPPTDDDSITPLYTAPPDAPTVKESLTHPGYIIGNHWFETAYERLCAGEAEDAILEDYELVREPRLRDLRRDAERYRWLLIWLVKNGLLTWERCRIDSPASYGHWWILRKPKVIDGSSLIGYGKTAGAAIDAAMEASTAPASAAADSSTAPEAKP